MFARKEKESGSKCPKECVSALWHWVSGGREREISPDSLHQSNIHTHYMDSHSLLAPSYADTRCTCSPAHHVSCSCIIILSVLCVENCLTTSSHTQTAGSQVQTNNKNERDSHIREFFRGCSRGDGMVFFFPLCFPWHLNAGVGGACGGGYSHSLSSPPQVVCSNRQTRTQEKNEMLAKRWAPLLGFKTGNLLLALFSSHTPIHCLL